MRNGVRGASVLSYGVIGTALAEAAPEPEVRVDLARSAVARAPRIGPPRRRGRLVLAAAVAAVLAGALLVLLPGEPADAPEPVPAATVEGAREANTATLDGDAVRARLAATPEGAFVLIAGGKLIGIERDIGKLLAAARKTVPDAPHRFLFRVGTEGDVKYRTLMPIEAAVGMAFLRDAGLEFWEDPKQVEGLFKYDGTRLTARFQVGTGSWVPTEWEWEEAARPGGEVHREERVLHRREIELAVVTGFDGPMLLPEGFDLDEPARWEIPGIATIGGGDGEKRACRRILVSVGIPSPISRVLLAEALVPVAAPEPEIVEIRADWPQPGFMGGSYMDLPEDASIHEETRQSPGSDHRWSFVGFRAARPVPD